MQIVMHRSSFLCAVKKGMIVRVDKDLYYDSVEVGVPFVVIHLDCGHLLTNQSIGTSRRICAYLFNQAVQVIKILLLLIS